MHFDVRTAAWIVAASLVVSGNARAQEKKSYNGATGAAPVDQYFVNEVWAKVGAPACLKCHKPDGEAGDSKFILQNPDRSVGDAKVEALRHNRNAFVQMARQKEGDQSRLLLKAVGKLEHGGEAALMPDSAGYRVLGEFVQRLYAPPKVVVEDKNAPPFFEGIKLLDDRQLLRRVTLSLAGRLPTNEETEAIGKQERNALPALLDAVMKEDAFYNRLREGFNDIFLMVGIDGVADATVLSYEHFEQ